MEIRNPRIQVVGIFGVYRAALHGKQLLSERRSKNGSGSIETN
jgi:hypothetical protein